MASKTVQIERDRDSAGSNSELSTLSARARDPVISVSIAALEAYLHEVGGAKGISVPDVLEPQQISTPLYIGGTTPQASTEVPHWHPEQGESYFLIHGVTSMLFKYRWEATWHSKSAQAGDLLIVNPEVCHWFRWASPTGLALVFKAPQRAGVGRFPAGKVTCQFCPHYRRTCTLPSGFSPAK